MPFRFNPFTGNLDEVDTTAAAGSDSQVQVNDGGKLAGFLELLWNKVTKVFTVKGDISLDDGGTYTTTIQVITPTANRVISYPDATGTLALVAGSSGQLIWNNAGAYASLSTFTTDSNGNVTLSGRWTNNRANEADAPPVTLTGTWLTSGGTATTTKPQFLIEPAGTTSTGWTTAGTGFGVNAPSGFTGRLLDLQLNGTSRWHVTASGMVVGTQGDPAAANVTATLTVANIQSGIVTSTTAAAVDLTLPTGTLMDGGFSGVFTGMAVMWSVINTGSNAATLLAGANHTIVGAAAVAAASSGRFISRRTGATTWVTYRIS